VLIWNTRVWLMRDGKTAWCAQVTGPHKKAAAPEECVLWLSSKARADVGHALPCGRHGHQAQRPRGENH